MRGRARIVGIELEAFRGFATTQHLDFDADVVLVRGDNGTGKTSVTDGLLWVFTGAIPRLTERMKGLRKTRYDPIVNRYRADGPARVRLSISTSGGRLLAFERRGDLDSSTLTAWDGDEELNHPSEVLAEAVGDLTTDQLHQAVDSWGILQQHALRAALDSGTTLHDRLADVVGLGRVTRFTESASEVVRKLGSERKRLEAVRDSLRRRQASAATRLATARSQEVEGDAQSRLSAIVGPVIAELSDDITLREPTSLDELAASGQEINSLADRVRELVAAVEERDRISSDAAEAIDDIERELTQVTQYADAALRRAPAQVQLAQAALQLIEGDSCPVCRQHIDSTSVREHMAEVLQAAEAQATAASDAQRAVIDAQSRLQAARVAQRRQGVAEKRFQTALDDFNRALAAASWVTFGKEWSSADNLGGLVGPLVHLQTRLRQAYVDAQRNTGEEIARLSSEAEASETELTRTDSELSELIARCQRASELDAAAHRAAARMVDRALERLAPSFAEVFDRLAPHPTFTELRATQDIYYGKKRVVPEVYDPEHKVAGNPVLIFSEGQLNVVALSYFLGLALNAGDGALPFIVLDDPLQTMDVLGVLGFADLCRRLREQRQLILTTHDRRFAALLARKLAPRVTDTRTILHEFEGWTADGPELRTSEEPLAEVVPLLGRRAS
jgi:DNA repair exonuclease SbcCD ATPase subunit